jgi:DNA-binding GntR family transcriptional regulator
MSIPVYQQIKDILREEIRQGKYKAGNTIPSANQLAKDFSTSRNTSVKAIADLVHEGIVYTVQGKGTIVSDLRKEIKESKLKKRNSSVPGIVIILADFDNINHPYMAKTIKGNMRKKRLV